MILLLPPIRIFLLVYLAGSLASCSGVSTVRSIQDQPRRSWWNARVSLQGTIGDRAPLIEGQVYELTDSTGSIWVLSPDQTARSGEQVQVQGLVRFQPIELAGQNESTAFIEEQQRQPLPADQR
ncbi:MAG: hypothetical protein MUF72_04890 [Elainella sp. Prado103]|jgi:uncharacterized protein YdeI (BOF family)|nr:hypothetical protein [Elainella sp. Prado103]